MRFKRALPTVSRLLEAPLYVYVTIYNIRIILMINSSNNNNNKNKPKKYIYIYTRTSLNVETSSGGARKPPKTARPPVEPAPRPVAGDRGHAGWHGALHGRDGLRAGRVGGRGVG